MRSKLFVPGSRPELFAKALQSQADALSFDLEDAVAEARKDEARGLLCDFLQSPASQGHGKTFIVRVNAMDTPHFESDIAAVVREGVHLVNLPKPETAEQVRQAAQCVQRAARANGVAAVPGLLLNIETPKALRCAAELAGAHASVAGLQLGLGDLFEPFGVNRREAGAIVQTLFALRMAAAEAGIYAYDGAFADIQDRDGFEAEARLAQPRVPGQDLHPSQPGRPGQRRLPAHAGRDRLGPQGGRCGPPGRWAGAGRLCGGRKDGGPPFVIRAQAIVASARAAGLLSG